jgi:hypothetical protein
MSVTIGLLVEWRECRADVLLIKLSSTEEGFSEMLWAWHIKQAIEEAFYPW